MDTGGDGPKTFTLTEAEKYLSVSRVTLWRLIRQYKVPTFTDILDRRVKRVRRSDINRILADADRVREGEAA
jgi:predicted DNA-binding transcriptional regulator AlpA